MVITCHILQRHCWPGNVEASGDLVPSQNLQGQTCLNVPARTGRQGAEKTFVNMGWRAIEGMEMEFAHGGSPGPIWKERMSWSSDGSRIALGNMVQLRGLIKPWRVICFGPTPDSWRWSPAWSTRSRSGAKDAHVTCFFGFSSGSIEGEKWQWTVNMWASDRQPPCPYPRPWGLGKTQWHESASSLPSPTASALWQLEKNNWPTSLSPERTSCTRICERIVYYLYRGHQSGFGKTSEGTCGWFGTCRPC